MPAPFIAAFLAFVGFCLAMDRQHRVLLGRPCPQRRATALRIGAWVCLAVSFVAAIVVWGRIIGPVVWVGAVMMAAASTFLVVNFGVQRPIIAAMAPPDRRSGDNR